MLKALTGDAVDHGVSGRETRRDLVVAGLPQHDRRHDSHTVIEKYTGVLAAADVFREDVAFQMMQSVRLGLGYGAQVHP